jgi:hypothetical protein
VVAEDLEDRPLSDKSSTRTSSGKVFKASSIPARFNREPPLFFALSDAAFNKIGVLLIFVSMPIKAKDSAVELRASSSSSRSGLSILEKMESCTGVGVMKTTYSTVDLTVKSWKMDGSAL